ncbi:hypothetical protein FRC08_006736 [Ceratobasidium sp. 394]|nr:hypothetical protein FRC08_006736 [Ceratobasidium sp. 394]KAG9089184.1 hypothetical protein FS749_001546 [Ceratobasidium sp. UAMH 11750]
MASRSRKIATSSCPPTTRLRYLERQEYLDGDSDDSIEKTNSSAFVQITFIALGISSLLPWNAIVTVLPFFLDRLRGTPLHDSFASWLSFVFNGVGLVAMGLATWAGDRFTRPSSFSISIIILISLFAFLAVIPFLVFSPPVFFAVALSTSSLLAAAGGFLQTSTITLAPRYGSGAIASYMAGSALSAVGVSVLQVATAYTSTGITLPDIDSASWSATICFMTSAMVLALTLVSFRALGRENDGFGGPGSYKDFDVGTPPSERTRLLRSRSQLLLRTPRIQTAELEYPATYFGCSFAIFYAGIVTLCLFPAITATIEPINTRIDPLLFNAIHFLVFNIADLAGRSLASVRLLSPTNDTFLSTYSLLRTVFVPFFIACNVAGSSRPAVVTSDTTYMLGLFLLGLTHGHCSTLSLVAASETEDEKQRGRATRLTQFWMMAGIVVGGGASFGVRALL